MAAGDFYFAINATFRFILQQFGEQALIDYWRAMGEEYYAPLSKRFREGGLEEVERYWREFFAVEPGGDVVVTASDDSVEIDVRECPAIRWLRVHGRDIVPHYCNHCHHVSTVIAENAGLAFAVEGGGGSCHQAFSAKREEAVL
ncbi:MAG: hypothetical protein K1Y02_06515 [Candidatus Hydrogenedentes bacterium]|nr:hypothetical protein [Candidatus Hydrogenedentota bacterium]